MKRLTGVALLGALLGSGMLGSGLGSASAATDLCTARTVDAAQVESVDRPDVQGTGQFDGATASGCGEVQADVADNCATADLDGQAHLAADPWDVEFFGLPLDPAAACVPAVDPGPLPVGVQIWQGEGANGWSYCFSETARVDAIGFEDNGGTTCT